MATAIEKVISVAEAEIGYLEKKTNSDLDSKTGNAGSANYTKYARDMALLGAYNSNKNGYAWCDVFVDWCLMKAFGINTAHKITGQALKGLGAGCTYSAAYYKAMNRFDKNPKVGDQIFFSNDGGKTMYHTGLVYKVDQYAVYTIEGNTSGLKGVVANGGAVCRKTYLKSYSYIGGYGHPKYELVAGEVKVDAPAAMGTTDEKNIWNYLKGVGLNQYGIAALMGGLYSMSGLVATNLAKGSATKLGYADATYTKAVDTGSYTKFSTDGSGYGLLQWTHRERKANLLSFAKTQKTSIGDIMMQLAFVVNELKKSYKSVYTRLTNAISVQEAANAVATSYIGDSSSSMKTKVAKYGQSYYNKYAKEDKTMTDAEFTAALLRYRKNLQDNDSSDFSKDARAWAIKNDIIQGAGELKNGDPNYMWQDWLTREQFVAMLYRTEVARKEGKLKF